MAKNPANTPLFMSTEMVKKRSRKQSVQLTQNRNLQTDLFKVPRSISDLDVSLIEKKPSRASQLQNKNSLYDISSPQQKGLRRSLGGRPPSSLPHNQSKQSSPSKQPPSQKQQQYQQQERQCSDLNLSQSLLKQNNQNINWRSIWLYLKLILFSYEFNLLDYLNDIDSQTAKKVTQLLKIAPGYKHVQYIYTFYMLKYGLLMGTLAAIIYPLPYSILFLMITIDVNVPFVAIFMLAGMRSGAIALLLKYCLHFPKQVFHWIVLVFTVLIGVFLPNNYIFLLLFGISIFLSFYLPTSQPRTSTAQDPQQQPGSLIVSSFGLNFSQQQIYKQYKVYDNLPQTYANASIGLLAFSALLLWVLRRYFENREIDIFGQIMPISLLNSSKEMLAFFPYIYKQTIGQSTLSSNTLISLSFLFPGPHSKAFMFFIIHTQINNVIIGYLCLYLPPILLANIFIGYRPHFFTRTYYNIRQSIQAVGNAIVFCLVYEMLRNQECFFKSICYSAVVIMVVAKLYKLRELFAITLGIFLISARTIILNINKGIPFQVQACLEPIVASLQ